MSDEIKDEVDRLMEIVVGRVYENKDIVDGRKRKSVEHVKVDELTSDGVRYTYGDGEYGCCSRLCFLKYFTRL